MCESDRKECEKNLFELGGRKKDERGEREREGEGEGGREKERERERERERVDLLQ